jgi:hypothetical protein
MGRAHLKRDDAGYEQSLGVCVVVRVGLVVLDFVNGLTEEETECRFWCNVELAGRAEEGVNDSGDGSRELRMSGACVCVWCVDKGDKRTSPVTGLMWARDEA